MLTEGLELLEVTKAARVIYNVLDSMHMLHAQEALGNLATVLERGSFKQVTAVCFCHFLLASLVGRAA